MERSAFPYRSLVAVATMTMVYYVAIATTFVSKTTAFTVPTLNKFMSLKTSATRRTTSHRRYVSTDLENETTTDDSATTIKNGRSKQYDNIPSALRTTGSGIPSRKEKIQILESAMYESKLIQTWDETTQEHQKGFDWEIEKLRRYFAGLRMREDGTWIRQPSFFDFLVNRSYINSSASADAPRPVGMVDVIQLTMYNLISAIGFGPVLGMAAVPTAVIQKYEGSFFSFIKGVLGGDLQTLAGGPLFLLLAKYFHDYGPIFNLSFGPKSFLVISDPVMARHILRESNPDQYCKGMLAEILEPIMGKGLIPADPATWKVRRRAIVPSFHKKWLMRMINMFADRATILVNDLQPKVETQEIVDLEERFCSVTLDIIGKAVFDYDFGSVTNESPIVKAVYRVLREAEHRSSSFIPYWDLPYADQWMGGQVEFRKDMTMLDDILADLINRAILTRKEASIEELEERDNAEDSSILRFLVDMRGEDVSSMVLRDDLMTMLIAGHETTAAMLTWALFELSRGPPGLLKEVQHEVRTVLANKDRPDYDDIVAMKKLRYSLIESLRLYPEPPVLIRRARTEDILPPGSSTLYDGIKVLRGTDIFISTWNLNRSPALWDQPEVYDPTRYERSFKNPIVVGWDGFDPDKVTGLYPNEQATDFAFLPFGGGARKCVGDQFAMMEAAVTLSILLKNFNFEFAISPDDVGMKTGATIHTMNGLQMRVSKAVTNDSASTTASPKTEGWWEMQHLKRGLNANGRPFHDENEIVSSHRQTSTSSNSTSANCPIR
jgi:cytochrome P450 family 97 subfamily B polypeptide 3